ncbi:hypothetical protein ACFLWZ_07645 [Chloroflexota bacterium]
MDFGIIGVYLWLGILSESPRLKVTFGGGSRPGHADIGDDSYHVGGAIFEFVATVSNTGGKYVGKIPEYCPGLLVLDPEDTKKHSLLFFVKKDFVDRIGVDEYDTIRVFSAEHNLKFVDRGLGIEFECVDKGRNKFECKRSRIH